MPTPTPSPDSHAEHCAWLAGWRTRLIAQNDASMRKRLSPEEYVAYRAEIEAIRAAMGPES